jgi:hypothetical protein
MLVDHPDSSLDRIAGRLERHRQAVDPEIARVRPVETGEDAHQGRFAGAIFPNQCMDFALAGDERHVVVGNHRSETLGNAQHCHRFGPGRLRVDNEVMVSGRIHRRGMIGQRRGLQKDSWGIREAQLDSKRELSGL